MLPGFETTLVLKLLFVFIFAKRKLFNRILTMAFKDIPVNCYDTDTL